MRRTSAKPVDQIRTADRAAAEIAWHPLCGHSTWNADNWQAQRGFHGAAAGLLWEPAAARFGYPPAVSSVARASDPVTFLANADHNALQGVDVLEALVYLADPTARCRELAENAIQVFGSVGAVLSAPISDLIAKLGLRYQIACTLKAIHIGIRSVVQEPAQERIRIGSLDELVRYVRLSLKHETSQILQLLFLDRKNGLISEERASRGTVDCVPIYPREIVKRALELGASAVIMVRSGDPTPTETDVSFSQQAQAALSVMAILLHDYILVGRSNFVSLRSLGRL